MMRTEEGGRQGGREGVPGFEGSVAAGGGPSDLGVGGEGVDVLDLTERREGGREGGRERR